LPESTSQVELLPSSAGPELLFGLVGATGTNLGFVEQQLVQVLATFGYESETVRVIELLESFEQWRDLPSAGVFEEKRIEERMDAGDAFRGRIGHGNALARMIVTNVRYRREKRTGDPMQVQSRRAYILRSLKRTEEVEHLRTVYGPNFFLIGAFAPRSERVTGLASAIATSHYSASSDAFRSLAEHLVQRDLEDQTKQLGQRVGDTFPLADVFVNVSDATHLYNALARFVRIIFGHPFHTPTRDEYGMFHAQAAAFRSAALSRQVGAAIATGSGAIVSVGTNEVPKAGGGSYWEGDDPDARDHILRQDSSDIVRRNMLAEILERLIRAGWIADSKAKVAIDALMTEALGQATPPILRGSQIMRVIEYGRAVHAEMAAIVDAASRGVSVAGATLYATTYPCHNCARHIIAAGIRRVVYVEPYPKSLTFELHKDAMLNDAEGTGRVSFQAFIGLAPRRYMDFFEMVERKDSTGKIVPWDKRSAVPRRVPLTPGYLVPELLDAMDFVKKVTTVGIIRNGGTANAG
jgi:cytidine deaminase